MSYKDGKLNNIKNASMIIHDAKPMNSLVATQDKMGVVECIFIHLFVYLLEQ